MLLFINKLIFYTYPYTFIEKCEFVGFLSLNHATTEQQIKVIFNTDIAESEKSDIAYFSSR